MKEFMVFSIFFGLIIALHELGHFAAARIFGVKVLRFAIGFGPKIFQHQTTSTHFSVNLIPIGGSVRLLGEMPWEYVPEDQKGNSFSHQSVGRKVLILLAGPASNIILSLLMIFIVNAFGGFKGALMPEIVAVTPNSPAAVAGLRVGDKLVEIKGEKIYSNDKLQETLRHHSDANLDMKVERGGGIVGVLINNTGTGPMGFSVGVATGSKPGRKTGNAFTVSIFQMSRVSAMTVTCFAKALATGELDGLGGPLRMAVDATKYLSQGMLNFMFFMAIINLSLGVFNLLPLPALDGGHIAHILLEKITGVQIGFQVYRVIISISFGLLSAFMLLLFRNDLRMLFN